jgi:hypothetical protein
MDIIKIEPHSDSETFTKLSSYEKLLTDSQSEDYSALKAVPVLKSEIEVSCPLSCLYCTMIDYT